MSGLIIGDDEFDLEQLLNDPDFLNDVDFLNESPGQGSGPGQEQDPDPKQKFVEIEKLLMNDEYDDDDGNKGSIFNMLLDSPVESDDSNSNSKASCVEEVGKGEYNGFDLKADSPDCENCGEEDTKKRSKESEDGEEEEEDPVTKKRKRYFVIFNDFVDSLIEC